MSLMSGVDRDATLSAPMPGNKTAMRGGRASIGLLRLKRAQERCQTRYLAICEAPEDPAPGTWLRRPDMTLTIHTDRRAIGASA
jgi:hypothetical protein